VAVRGPWQAAGGPRENEGRIEDRVSKIEHPLRATAKRKRGPRQRAPVSCGRAISRVLSPRFRGAAISLGRALPRASSDLPGVQARRATSPPVRSCSGWGLPCRGRRRPRGALLPHLFTLAAGLSPRSAVCFLWRCPGRGPLEPRRWALPTTLPCGARTFLDARPEGPRRGRTRPLFHCTSGPRGGKGEREKGGPSDRATRGLGDGATGRADDRATRRPGDNAGATVVRGPQAEHRGPEGEDGARVNGEWSMVIGEWSSVGR
jgi:hypothetical protein